MISKEQIAELVRLYSEFHGALDLPYEEFRRYAIRECKLFLRKN